MRRRSPTAGSTWHRAASEWYVQLPLSSSAQLQQLHLLHTQTFINTGCQIVQPACRSYVCLPSIRQTGRPCSWMGISQS